MPPRRRPARLALAPALLALAACAGARPAGPPAAGAAPVARRAAFEVPGHGALDVAVPAGWSAEAEEGEPPAPVTVRLGRAGEKFVVLLTPFWNPGEPEDEPAGADTAQLLAEIARRGALAGAVEREIPLQELVGEGVHGYWFAATDRELVGKETGPDEWRCLLQGAAAIGPLVVAFTLLDDGPGPQRAAVLELVRGARHRPAGATEPRPPTAGLEVDPDAPTVPLRVAARGRTWTLLVDLPGFRVFKPRTSEDGVGVLVVAESPESGIVASVILRHAGEARDAPGCREVDLARIRAATSDLRELRVATARGSARAGYALPAPPEASGRAAREEHAHAWLFRDEVCANVHVSKADPGPEDLERMERILASVRFGEEL